VRPSATQAPTELGVSTALSQVSLRLSLQPTTSDTPTMTTTIRDIMQGRVSVLYHKKPIVTVGPRRGLRAERQAERIDEVNRLGFSESWLS